MGGFISMNTFPVAELDFARTKGDTMADAAVQNAMRSESASFMTILRSLTTNNMLVDAPDLLRPLIQDVMHLPDWANDQRMKRGAEFFRKYPQQLMSMLGLVSLPYCYAAVQGVKVLHQTGRLTTGAMKRLSETSILYLDVTDKKAFEPEGSGFVSILKVRLIHAFVRYSLLNSGKWNSEEWGIPINQEDMAGTNLAFGLIPVRGMIRSGIRVDNDAFSDYLHLWRVVGDLLGIEEHLNPISIKEAQILDKRISGRNFGHSPEGVELTDRLIEVMLEQVNIGISEDQLRGYMAYLLGDQVASYVGLSESRLDAVELNLVKAISGLQQFIASNDRMISEMKRQLKRQEVRLSIN